MNADQVFAAPEQLQLKKRVKIRRYRTPKIDLRRKLKGWKLTHSDNVRIATIAISDRVPV